MGLIREAIEVCLEAMEEDGEAIPAPQAYELTEVSSSGTQGGGFRELRIGRSRGRWVSWKSVALALGKSWVGIPFGPPSPSTTVAGSAR